MTSLIYAIFIIIKKSQFLLKKQNLVKQKLIKSKLFISKYNENKFFNNNYKNLCFTFVHFIKL